jgi:hypothetical protein
MSNRGGYDREHAEQTHDRRHAWMNETVAPIDSRERREARRKDEHEQSLIRAHLEQAVGLGFLAPVRHHDAVVSDENSKPA